MADYLEELAGEMDAADPTVGDIEIQELYNQLRSPASRGTWCFADGYGA